MSVDLVGQGSWALGSILATSGGGIVVVESVRRRSLRQSVLAQRWLAWAALGPAWLAAAAWGPARLALLGGFAAISVVEYAKLRPALVAADRWLLVGWAAVSVPLVGVIGIEPLVVVTVAAVTVIAIPLLSADTANGPYRVGDMLYGLMLVVLPLVLCERIVDETSGSMFFAIGLAVALSDVIAFVLGSTLGRRRCAPSLSPGKTYVGLLGNFVGAFVGFALAAVAGISPWSVLWLAPVIGAGAIVGDLMVSLLKRSRGVKDAGSWLPGFGGLLDRIDSLLVAAPLTYAAISLFGAGV